MKYVWKRVAAVFLVMLAVIQLPGGGTSCAAAGEIDNHKAVITVASNMSQQDMQEYLDGFQKKYPNITIKYHYYSDYENEVSKQIADNDYADVLFVPGSVSSDQYGEYFEPLGKKDQLDKKYNYLEGSKLWDDQIYGIPCSAYLNGILYNKKVFDKAGITETPKTIDDFLQALHAVKERTNAIPFYTNYAAGWPLQVWEQFPYIEMTGDPDYQGNGFVNELNPFSEGTTHYKVYNLLYKIVQEGLCEENPYKSDWDASKQMLNEGKIGCMAIGSWAMHQVKTAGKNGNDIAFMPFPAKVNGKQYMTIVTDYCYAINKNSKQKKAARCYIDYMMDESGYALDHEVLSLVRTDPIVESYGNMDNVICLSNNAASGENYQKKQALSANLDLFNSTDEIKRIVEAADNIRSETFDEIMEDWNERWESSRTEDMMPDTGADVSVLSTSIQNNYEIEFSDTEKNYLEDIRKLRIGYLRYNAPYAYETMEGVQGVAGKLLDQMEQEFDVETQAKSYNNTYELVRALENGEIDIAFGIRKCAEYGSDIKYSTEYLNGLYVIVKRSNKDTETALKGTMAQIKGEYYSEFKTNASDTIKMTNLKECLGAIEKSRTDFTVTDYYSAYYYIQEQGYTHLSTVPLAGNTSMYLAFSGDVDTRLISVCNKLIYSIPGDNLQMMLNDSMQEGKQKITLVRFIKANTVLCLFLLCVVFVIISGASILITRDRTRLAETDALTGLLNRYGLRAKINRIYEKNQFPIVFAIMDIDNFKSVNDTLGHAGGDEALKLLASTLKHTFGSKAVLGRYGGDEFILCTQCPDVKIVEAQMEYLVKCMDQTFTYGEASVPISISLGAIYIEKSMAFEELFNETDKVLYEVKEHGKNSFRIREI